VGWLLAPAGVLLILIGIGDVFYVLGIYGMLQQLGVLSAGLYRQAQDTSDPLSILTPHLTDGEH
jgi:hypothetical protein